MNEPRKQFVNETNKQTQFVENSEIQECMNCFLRWPFKFQFEKGNDKVSSWLDLFQENLSMTCLWDLGEISQF